jgi:hypothetical protein
MDSRYPRSSRFSDAGSLPLIRHHGCRHLVIIPGGVRRTPHLEGRELLRLAFPHSHTQRHSVGVRGFVCSIATLMRPGHDSLATLDRQHDLSPQMSRLFQVTSPFYGRKDRIRTCNPRAKVLSPADYITPRARDLRTPDAGHLPRIVQSGTDRERNWFHHQAPSQPLFPHRSS